MDNLSNFEAEVRYTLPKEFTLYDFEEGNMVLPCLDENVPSTAEDYFRVVRNSDKLSACFKFDNREISEQISSVVAWFGAIPRTM